MGKINFIKVVGKLKVPRPSNSPEVLEDCFLFLEARSNYNSIQGEGLVLRMEVYNNEDDLINKRNLKGTYKQVHVITVSQKKINHNGGDRKVIDKRFGDGSTLDINSNVTDKSKEYWVTKFSGDEYFHEVGVAIVIETRMMQSNPPAGTESDAYYEYKLWLNTYAKDKLSLVPKNAAAIAANELTLTVESIS